MSLAQLFYLKESIRKRVRRRFPRKAVHHSSQFTMEPLENRLLLSVTPVAPDLTTIANATNLEPNPVTQSAGTNEVVSFQLDYQDTGTGTGTSGLGLRIHYDSRQLRPGEAGVDGQFGTTDDVAVLTNLISTGPTTIFNGIQDQADTANADGNANTDRFVLVAWSDFTGGFPKGAAVLLVANFTTLSPAITPVGQPASTFTGTTINFTTSSRPIGRALNATSATITFDDPIRESVPGQPVTIVGPAGSLISGVTSIATPPNAPQGVTFPHGFFGLTIQDNSRVAGTALAAGGSITVDLLLPSTTNPNTYWKFGPEAGNSTPHFYEFLFDGTTGAQFDNDVDIDPGAGVTLADRVRLTYVDGGRGDADGLANGIIVDPGAPGVEAGDTTAPVLTGDFVNDTGFIDFNGVPGAGATDGVTSDLTTFVRIVDASPITRLDVALAKNGGPFSPFNSLLDLLQPDGTLTITNARWETILGSPLAPGPFGTGYQIHRIVEDAFGNRFEFKDVFPENGFYFDNTTPTSPGFITEVNGIAGITQTNDSTPTLTIDPFETFGVVHVFANGLEIGSHIVANVAQTDTFAFTPTTPLADGLYNLQLRAEDIAGNLTALALSSPLVLLIDTIAPVITSNGGGITAAISTPENSATVTTVTATDVNPLQFSIVGGADAAKFQLAGIGNNRSLSFLTAPNFETPTDVGNNNVYDVIVQVTDGIFNVQQAIAVTVLNGNEAPVLGAIGNRAIDELATLSFLATATDVDAGQTATFTLDAAALALGATINATTGAFSWTPTEAQGPGLYNVTITVSDNGTPQLNDSETIQIQVNEVNVDPVLGAIGDRTVDEGATLTFTISGTDADLPGNTLTFSAGPLPAGATFNATTRTFSWTPTEAQGPGVFTGIIFTVIDEQGRTDSETIQITVNEVNAAPVLGAIGNRTVQAGATLSFTVTATDADFPANLLTLSSNALPTGATFDANTGLFSWTPTAGQTGDTSLTFTVTDNGTPQLNDSETITLTVTTQPNRAPVANDDQYTVNEDGVLMGDAILVKDISTGGSVSSFASSGNSLVNVNGILFFKANNLGVTGFELWKSDGTAAGTVLVKDIVAGNVGSDPQLLTNANGTLFFFADDGVHGVELWKSDGTEAGTVLVKDINPGSGSTLLSNFTPYLVAVNGTSFFTAFDPVNGVELWKSDGSEAGTVIVKDIRPGASPNNAFPDLLTAVNGTLFFVANDGVNGPELWKSDGTTAGTVLIQNVNPAGGLHIAELAAVNNTLFFTANDGNGLELWKSDGTVGGVVQVANLNGLGSANPRFLTNVNGTLFFTATDVGIAEGLFKSDGTSVGTVLVKEVTDARDLTAVGNKLYFRASTPSVGVQAYASDGTAAGTGVLKLDLFLVGTATLFSGFADVNGTAFFAANDGITGVEIWKSDGTVAGTVLVEDINSGGSANPQSLTNVEGTLFFVAAAPGIGLELWKVDGSVNVLANDRDPDGNALTAVLVNGPQHGTLTLNPDGTFVYTPNANFSGTDSFIYKANDGSLDSNQATVTLIVTAAANQAPVVNDQTFLIAENSVNGTVVGTILATDADVGQALAYALTGTAFAVNTATGQITVANSALLNFETTPSFTLTATVTDNGTPNLNDTAVITINLTDVNEAPVLGTIGNQAIDELATLSFLATATDVDAGQTATFTLDATSLGLGMTINATTGAFSWTPTEAQGPGLYNVTITVSDNGTPQLNDSETIQITVNEVNGDPVLGAIGNQTVNEGATLTFTISGTDADLPGQTLTYSASNLPTGATFDPNTRTFSWTPTEAQGPGVFTGIVFTVNDGQGGTDSETISITVNEVNQAPVLGAIGNRTVQVGATLSFTVTATDADFPANLLTLSSNALPTGATFDANTGLFSWTPTAGQTGDTPLTFTVTDNGTPQLNDSETITLTVTAEPNQPPVVNDQSFAIAENSANGTVVGTIAANDPDVSQALSYLLTGTAFAVNTTTGQITVANSALLNFETTPSFTLTATVTDNGTPNLNDTAVITITLTDVNEAPVLGAIGNQLINELATLSFLATATDVDAGQTATFTLDAAALALGATINATTGAFSWTPTEAQGPGLYNVTITVSDNGTPQLNDSETIQITVNEVNGDPVLGAIGNQLVNEGATLTFTISGTDADLPGNTLSFSAGPLPTGATFDPNTRTFSWTPTEAQGPGVFPGITFTVNDGQGGTDSETISITVAEVNQAPVLGAIGNKIVQVGQTLSFTVTATDADLPANVLTLSSTALPTGATFDVNTGAFSWTPTAGQTGDTSLTFTVTDNGTPQLNDSETITLTVTAETGGFPQPVQFDLPTVQNAINLEPNPLTKVLLPNTAFDFQLDYLDTGTSGSTGLGLRIHYDSTQLLPGQAGVSGVLTNLITVPSSTLLQGIQDQADTSNFDGNTSTDRFILVAWADLSSAFPKGPAALFVAHFTSTAAFTGSTINFTTSSRPVGRALNAASIQLTAEQQQVNLPPVVNDQSFAVAENSANGTVVGTIAATDPNVGQALSYLLTGTAFAVNTTTGQITVANSALLNFETTPTFTLTATVTDNGTPNLNDTAVITITLTDVNEAPVLGAIGNQLINELATLSFLATATDVDAGQTATFTLDAAALALGATINATTGAFSWTPTEAQGPGLYNVTITVSDNGTPQLNDSETIQIAVTEVNGDPVLGAIGNQLVNEGATLTFTISGTDADLPGQTLTYSASNLPPGATFDPNTRTFSWTPTEAQGPNIFTGILFTVTDGQGGTDSETISITVAEVNQAPVLGAIGNKTVQVGQTLSFTVTATDADFPANVLTLSSNAVPTGATFDANTGLFSWTPTAGQTGDTSLTFTVTDNGTPQLNDSETITLNVTAETDGDGDGVLDRIEAGDFNNDGTVDSAQANVASLFDVSGVNRVTFVGPEGTVFRNMQAVVSPAGGPTDTTFPFGFFDFDLEGVSSGGTVVVQLLLSAGSGVNTYWKFGPETSNTTLHFYEFLFNGTTGAIIETNVDLDPGAGTILRDRVTLTFVDGGRGDSDLAANGVISDPGGPGIEDNQPPVVNDQSFAVAENSVNGTVVGTIAATDPNVGQALSYLLTGTAFAVNTTTGQITVANSALLNFETTPSFTLTATVTDNGTPNLNDTAVITINLTDVNEAPVLGAIGNRAIDELATLSFLATVTDVDAEQTATFTLDATSLGLGVTINATTGAFSWTPTEAQGPNTYNVTITVTDNGNPQQSDSETIQIQVNEVNVDPVLGAIGNQTVDEGATLTFTISGTDADLPGNTLTFSAGPLPTGATFDPNTRTFSWTPTEAQGPGVFPGITFTVNDGQGGTDSETISITVNEVNQAPILGAIGNRTVQVGQTLSFTVTATDPDFPANLLTLSSSALPTDATFDAMTGVFSWTPTAGQTGDRPLTFTVTDNGSPQLSDSETITLTVTAEQGNRNPDAVDDAATTKKNQQVAFNVLANDNDSDDDTLTVTAVTNPQHGTIEIQGACLVYTPDRNFTGTDSVVYTISDGNGGTDTAIFTIRVLQDRNHKPQTQNDSYTVEEDGVLTVSGPGVLENDRDRDGDQLVASLVEGPDYGTLSLNADGSFVYTPDANFNGKDSFTYQASDGAEDSRITKVTIRVTSVNDEPVLDAIPDQTVEEGSKLKFTVTATDADGPKDKLTFSLGEGAPAGATINSKTGEFKWTPSAQQGPGVYEITVKVTDGEATDYRTFTVTVTDRIITETLIIRGTTGCDIIKVCEEDGGLLKVSINGNKTSYKLAAGTEIKVLGLDGDDIIILKGLNRDATVEGGKGDDIINGRGVHHGNLTLKGGNGNDILLGGKGNDLLKGGDGNDLLVGGEGCDTLDGGPGCDREYQGDGPQWLAKEYQGSKSWLCEFLCGRG